MWPRRPGSLTQAYLRPDSAPVLVGELAATLVLQLLQDAAVYGQAAVDLCEELVHVRVVGTQDAATDLCELSTREGADLAPTGKLLARGSRQAPSVVLNPEFCWLPAGLQLST